MFELHPRLVADCKIIGAFPLSLVLLNRDARYPWCILVPQRENIEELHHLDDADRVSLMRESCLLAEVMDELFSPDKLNVAVLGNVVPQLHMHHVARFNTDEAWPGPVWGYGVTKAYEEGLLKSRMDKLKNALAGQLVSMT